MNLIAEMWYYSEICSHNKEDSGDGDNDFRDYIRDKIEIEVKPNIFIQMENAIEYCYLIDKPDKVVIVFRGTDGTKAWLNNARMLPPYVRGYMHRGFHELINMFLPGIIDFLKNKENDKPIYITGHSLGGIMSQYCALFLYEKLGIKSTCVNFGSPVGGLKQWGDVIDSYPIKNIRVVNGWDLVTEICDEIVGKHGGELIRLKQPIYRKYIKVLQLYDHAYSRYTDAIIRYCSDLNDKEAVELMKKTRKECTI